MAWWFKGLALLSLLGVTTVQAQESSTEACGNEMSITMVIDTTSSMKHPLRHIKRHSQRIVNTLKKTKNHRVRNFVVVPFNDPEIGPVFRTTSGAQFLDFLNGTKPFGGGDCPERIMTAVRLAAENSCPHSTIYVFTDAEPKDEEQLGPILEVVQARQQHVIFILSGSCNEGKTPAYNAMKTIAATSGGQLFHVKAKDVGSIMEFARLGLKPQPTVLLSWQLHRPSSGNDAKDLSISVPVDESITSVTGYVSCAGGTPRIRLTAPKNQERPAVDGQQRYGILGSNAMRFLEKPSVGMWSMHVSSKSECMIRVIGTSEKMVTTTFRDAKLPESGGSRLEIEDRSFAIEDGATASQGTTPTRDEDTYLYFDSHGQLINAVEFRSIEGEPLQSLPVRVTGLIRGQNWTTARPVVLGPVRSPGEAFYVRYQGNGRGMPIVRYSATAIWPKEPEDRASPGSNRPTLQAAVCGSLTATCSVATPQGEQVPSVWRHNGTLVRPTSRLSISGSMQSTLKVEPVYRSDAGSYSCTPAQPSGPLHTAYLRIQVEGSGRSCDHQLPRHAILWRSRHCVQLVCNLRDIRPGTLSWQVNGANILHDGRTFFVFNNGTLNTCGEEEVIAGEYMCTALNRAGLEVWLSTVIQGWTEAQQPVAGVLATDPLDSCAKHDCHPNAACIQTLRGYRCECSDGFEGDGRMCTQITVRVMCKHPGTPAKASTQSSSSSPDGRFAVGERVFFFCQAGYRRTGTAVRQCRSNGLWSGSQPRCTMISCPVPKNPANGRVTLFTGVSYGASVFFSCSSGFRLSGDATRTCQANGLWSGSEAQCQDVDECSTGQNDCHSASQCTNSKGSFTCRCGFGYIGDGKTCVQFQESQGASSIVEVQGRVWIEESTGRPLLGNDGCVTLPCKVHGTAAPMVLWTLNGQFLSFTQGSGYVPQRSGSLKICPYDTVRHQGSYTCTAIDGQHRTAMSVYHLGPGVSLKELNRCPLLDQPENGKVIYSDGTAAGSIATYSCRHGYVPSNPNTNRVCQSATLTWSGEAQQCVQRRPTVRTCPALQPPRNGYLTYSQHQAVNSVVTYHCNNGHEVQGQRSRRCKPNGQWSSTAPTCDRPLVKMIEVTRPTLSCLKLTCRTVSRAVGVFWSHSTNGAPIKTGGKYAVTLEDNALMICDGAKAEASPYCCVANAAGRRQSVCRSLRASEFPKCNAQS